MTITPPALHDPVSTLRGVGGRVREKLDRLGIEHVRDLLFHLPLRYIDRTRLCPIGAVRAGMYAQVEGSIELAQVRYGKRRMLLCRISDGTGALTLRFFHFNKQQLEQLQRGLKVRCYGQTRFGAQTLEMAHPMYRVLAEDQSPPVEETLTPVYPATEGLHQATLRKLTGQALAALETGGAELRELLPETVRRKFRLPELGRAIAYVHRPPPDAVTEQLLAGTHPAQQRLAFEELLAQYLSLQRLRRELRNQKASALPAPGNLIEKFLHKLPFTLTAAQQRAVAEIQNDLHQPVPMLRLLQGDVGSGKTVVAALAALQAIESGFQAALMAPTELLAEQHYSTLQQWCRPLEVRVVLHTGKLGRAERAERIKIIAEERSCLVVGTHALFQQDVAFSRLRLVIIDEQHRFGV
ncbi:MAG: DEAD/DEAH box helicase, partial [Gammaproteobacteria bacterium]